jgi:adenylyltransferase/sulfurtransferase
MGVFQANEVLKLILGVGEPLSGKLLLFNSLSNKTEIIDLGEARSTALTLEEFEKTNYSLSCGVVKELTAKDLHQHLLSGKHIQTVDVREKNEQPKIPLLEQYSTALSDLQKEGIAVVYCQSGERSRKAILQLQEHTNDLNIFNLKGGVNEWVNTFPNTLTATQCQ